MTSFVRSCLQKLSSIIQHTNIHKGALYKDAQNA